MLGYKRIPLNAIDVEDCLSLKQITAVYNGSSVEKIKMCGYPGETKHGSQINASLDIKQGINIYAQVTYLSLP